MEKKTKGEYKEKLWQLSQDLQRLKTEEKELRRQYGVSNCPYQIGEIIRVTYRDKTWKEGEIDIVHSELSYHHHPSEMKWKLEVNFYPSGKEAFSVLEGEYDSIEVLGHNKWMKWRYELTRDSINEEFENRDNKDLTRGDIVRLMERYNEYHAKYPHEWMQAPPVIGIRGSYLEQIWGNGYGNVGEHLQRLDAGEIPTMCCCGVWWCSGISHVH